MDRCETCLFWNKDVEGRKGSGRCVVRSPRINKLTGLGVWPITIATDRCGEYAPREETP